MEKTITYLSNLVYLDAYIFLTLQLIYFVDTQLVHGMEWQYKG